MSEAASHGQASPFNATPLRTGLRARISWICHALRIAAVVWIGWVMVLTFVAWSDKANILQNYGRLFSADLSDVSAARYATAIVVVILSVAAAVPVVICIWRQHLPRRERLHRRRCSLASPHRHRRDIRHRVQRDRSRRGGEYSHESIGAALVARLPLRPSAGCPSPDLRLLRLGARPHLQGGGRDGR
jgi:hypothetical protein